MYWHRFALPRKIQRSQHPSRQPKTEKEALSRAIRRTPHDRRTIPIHTESITLSAVLKWAGRVNTGGQAKKIILAGRVRVNDRVETRRGRQLVPGDRVTIDGDVTFVVVQTDASTSSNLAPDVS